MILFRPIHNLDTLFDAMPDAETEGDSLLESRLPTEAELDLALRWYLYITGTGPNTAALESLSLLVVNPDHFIRRVDETLLSRMEEEGLTTAFKEVVFFSTGISLSDEQAGGLISDLLNMGISSWADLFRYADALEGSLESVIEARVSAIKNFLDQLDRAGKTDLFIDTAVSTALGHFVQTVGNDLESQIAVSKGLSQLVNRITPEGIVSYVVDAPIKGAQVLFDTNGDGDPGDDEVVLSTDETGAFIVPHDLPALSMIASGGSDILTGATFTGTMSAPAGIAVINPLTTLVESLSSTQIEPINRAVAFTQSLGRLPATDHVLAFNPFEILQNEQVDNSTYQSALESQKIGQQILNTTTLVQETLRGFSPTPDVQKATTAAMAVGKILLASPLDTALLDETIIQSVFDEIVSDESGLEITPQAQARSAQLIGVMNQAISDVSSLTTLAATTRAIHDFVVEDQLLSPESLNSPHFSGIELQDVLVAAESVIITGLADPYATEIELTPQSVPSVPRPPSRPTSTQQSQTPSSSSGAAGSVAEPLQFSTGEILVAPGVVQHQGINGKSAIWSTQYNLWAEDAYGNELYTGTSRDPAVSDEFDVKLMGTLTDGVFRAYFPEQVVKLVLNVADAGLSSVNVEEIVFNRYVGEQTIFEIPLWLAVEAQFIPLISDEFGGAVLHPIVVDLDGTNSYETEIEEVIYLTNATTGDILAKQTRWREYDSTQGDWTDGIDLTTPRYPQFDRTGIDQLSGSGDIEVSVRASVTLLLPDDDESLEITNDFGTYPFDIDLLKQITFTVGDSGAQLSSSNEETARLQAQDDLVVGLNSVLNQGISDLTDLAVVGALGPSRQNWVDWLRSIFETSVLNDGQDQPISRWYDLIDSKDLYSLESSAPNYTTSPASEDALLSKIFETTIDRTANGSLEEKLINLFLSDYGGDQSAGNFETFEFVESSQWRRDPADYWRLNSASYDGNYRQNHGGYLVGTEAGDILFGSQNTDYLHGGDGDDVLIGDNIPSSLLKEADVNPRFGLDVDRQIILDSYTDDLSLADELFTDATTLLNLIDYDYYKDDFYIGEGSYLPAQTTRYFFQGSRDELYGGGGNDALYGGREQDLLVGVDGNDYLDGGTDTEPGWRSGTRGMNDMLIGGDGADTYVLDDGAVGTDLYDIFRDYDVNEDKIKLGSIDPSTLDLFELSNGYLALASTDQSTVYAITPVGSTAAWNVPSATYANWDFTGASSSSLFESIQFV